MIGNASRGLTADEVVARRARFGPNIVPTPPPRSLARIVIAQLSDLLVIILIVAAVLAAIVGESADVFAIAIIIILNAAFGAAQQRRADKAVASLAALAPALAQVLRDGEQQTINAAEIVPDDLVVLESGNRVPADLKLQSSEQLSLNEALLTGESIPVEKHVDSVVYQGTSVTRGRGIGVAIATGATTDFGKIALSLRHETRPKTPLQQRLDRLGRALSIFVVGACAAILAASIARGTPAMAAVLLSLSVAVAIVPEALPAVVTASLAFGAHRLARKKALVRELSAVESLGSVSCICVDKTGTLTENRMAVDRIDVASSQSERDEDSRKQALWRAMAMSNDVVTTLGETVGDPMEIALCRYAAENGVDRERELHAAPRIAAIAFSEDRARTTTVHQAQDGTAIVYTKGAAERVLPLCRNQHNYDPGQPTPSEVAAAMARSGLRVIAYATRTVRGTSSPAETALESDLMLLGLVGLLDPPRADAAAAVTKCQSAGVRLIMITGDHPETAKAVAVRIGLADASTQPLVGAEIDALSDAALADRLSSTSICARVSPATKLRIVKAFQARGEFVAMTGDGVNDAPALARANIGIAMGRSGTDVARDASAMVLLDDNFSTIVTAIAEGRRVYDNILKFVAYVLAGNLGELLVMAIALSRVIPTALLPIQILWINLLTDGVPGLALTLEPAEPRSMESPPRAPDAGILGAGLWPYIVRLGVVIAATTLLSAAIVSGNDALRFQTMVFGGLTCTQLAHAISLRRSDSLLHRALRGNGLLTLAIATTLGLQALVIYWPRAQRVFHTTALSVTDTVAILAASLVVIAWAEVEKLIRRKSRATRATSPTRTSSAISNVGPAPSS